MVNKACFTIVLLLQFSACLLAATNNDKSDEKKSTLDVGLDFTSNMSTFGQSSIVDAQPSLSPYVSYTGKKGLLLSASLYSIAKSDSTYSKKTYEADLMAGYQLTLFDLWTTSFTYTHFFYSKNSSSVKSSYTNQLQLNSSLDFSWINLGITGSLIKSTKYEPNISGYLSFPFSFDDFIVKDSYLSISVDIDANVSSQSFYFDQNRKLLKFLGKNTPFGNVTVKQIQSGTTPYPRLNKYIAENPAVKTRFSNFEETATMNDLLNAKNNFTLTSVGFSLPISYGVKNFTFSFTPTFNKQVNAPFIKTKWQFYFNTGLIYSFDL